MERALTQTMRSGGRQKPFFWRWVSAEGWKIRTSAHTGCFHMQLCKEQSWTMISSSFNPLVEQTGDPLSEQGRKSRAISRGAKHAFRSNLGSPTAHSRNMPVVRTESTPQARHEQKKRAHLSSLRNKGRKRRKLLPACRTLPSEEKLWYKRCVVQKCVVQSGSC